MHDHAAGGQAELMPDPAQRIVDLLISRLITDPRFPRMSWRAWSTMLQSLRQQIDDVLVEVEQEARTDAIREATVD
jgi:hypothetical protein